MSEDMWQEIKDVKTTTRSIAATVAGHTETLSRVEKQLTMQGGTLDGIVRSLEAFTAEIIASRHELRLTRLEPRDKQS